MVHSDGLQRSTRCPGGVALRYRDDKPAAESDTAAHAGLDYAPLYFVAVCSRRALPELPNLALVGDRDESVYAHCNSEIRRLIAAGA